MKPSRQTMSLFRDGLFRTFRARTSILGLARTPLRLNAQHQQDPIRIQHVRMGRPAFSSKRFLVNMFGTIAAIYIFDHVFLAPLTEALGPPEEVKQTNKEKPWKQVTNTSDGDQDDEEDEDSLFIPLIGTTKQIQPPPYRGSDPEWQAFVKFAKDPKISEQIRQELSNMILVACQKHPILVFRCGKEMKVRRHWLDVDFPMAPPPEFERSGIEIADDYIAWTTMPVDAATVFQIRKVVWPVHSLVAFMSFFKVIATSAVDTTLVAAGLKEPALEKQSIESLLAKRADLVQALQKGGQGLRTSSPTTKDPLSLPPPAPVSPSKSHAATSTDEEQPPAHIVQQARDMFSTHFKSPIHQFKMKFMRGMKATQAYPPRGSLFLSGFVELDCEKAWIVMDVKAAWDPKTEEFDTKSMVVALRRLQMKRQSPPGGR